jgi:hypothetical protein
MSRNFIPLLLVTIISAACGGGPPNKAANAAAENTNTVRSQTVDPAEMPPELSGKETNQPVNVPGIPNNPTPLPKGTTPTPGIPSEADLKKPFKPGATPTPGIPDQETIRKALGQRPTNVNLPPASGNTPMTQTSPQMKGNKKTGGRVQ